jgi:hypothetical protein
MLAHSWRRLYAALWRAYGSMKLAPGGGGYAAVKEDSAGVATHNNLIGSQSTIINGIEAFIIIMWVVSYVLYSILDFNM